MQIRLAGEMGFERGGCAQAGETSRQAAQRETREELGLDIDLQGVRPSLTVNFSRGFDDLYLVEREVDLRRLRLQREEVQNVAWASQSEVLGDAGKRRVHSLSAQFDGTFVRYARKDGHVAVPWPENS